MILANNLNQKTLTQLDTKCRGQTNGQRACARLKILVFLFGVLNKKIETNG